MSEARLRDALGSPARIKRFRASESGFPIVALLYARRGLEVELHGTRRVVGRVVSRSSAYRTREGARVGIAEGELKKKLPDVDCQPADPHERWCALGSGAKGGRQTVFVVRRGLVREISVTVVF